MIRLAASDTHFHSPFLVNSCGNKLSAFRSGWIDEQKCAWDVYVQDTCKHEAIKWSGPDTCEDLTLDTIVSIIKSKDGVKVDEENRPLIH